MADLRLLTFQLFIIFISPLEDEGKGVWKP